MAEPRSLPECPSTPNCVSSQACAPARRVEPLRFVGDPAGAMRELRRIVESMERVRVVEAGPDSLHAEFRSLLGFVDDLDLLLDAEAGLVHVRSASRLGYSDLGVNRRRVEAIRRAFTP